MIDASAVRTGGLHAAGRVEQRVSVLRDEAFAEADDDHRTRAHDRGRGVDALDLPLAESFQLAKRLPKRLAARAACSTTRGSLHGREILWRRAAAL